MTILREGCTTFSVCDTHDLGRWCEVPRTPPDSEAVERVVPGDRLPLLDRRDGDARGGVVGIGAQHPVELLAAVDEEDQQRAAVLGPPARGQQSPVGRQSRERLAVPGAQTESRGV